MKRVYVAGPFRSDSTLGTFDNMRAGFDACEAVDNLGHASFCPWLDYTFALRHKVDVTRLQARCMAWLEAADAVYMAPNWARSEGARAEHERARELKIPVFHSIKELAKWPKEAE